MENWHEHCQVDQDPISFNNINRLLGRKVRKIKKIKK